MRFGLPDRTSDTIRDLRAFPAQSSVLDEQALLHRVVHNYDLPPVKSCRFLTRGDSDVYLVRTDGPDYFLKIRCPPISVAQCESEARLVDDLADAGLPVVRAVKLRRGGFASAVTAAEGDRAILIFQCAPPVLRGPLDLHQSKQLGRLLARIHVAADGRELYAGIPAADLNSIHRAVGDVLNPVDLSQNQQDTLDRAVSYVTSMYESLPRSAPSFGVIHGDLALSNIRIAVDRTLWLFDFGAAQRGWRANELLNARHRALPSTDAAWAAFMQGYSSVTTPPAPLEELEKPYRLYGKLRLMSYICNALTLRRGIEVIEEFEIPRQIEEVRTMLDV